MFDDLRQRLLEKGSLDLVIRVRPHASKTQLISVLGDGSLKMDIAAPAEDNRGNIVLVHALADAFALPVAQIKILSGKTGRMKLVRVSV
jgi:uncharacterized protein YggU (UPF0235/DUF167 family)